MQQKYTLQYILNNIIKQIKVYIKRLKIKINDQKQFIFKMYF